MNYKPFLVLSLILLAPPAFAENKWAYKKYAELKKNDAVLFTLEYGIKKKYNGYAKWRITNHSNLPVYNISINDKIYTMSDGRKISRLGESLTRKLLPGETKKTMSDAVNSAENYGNWSDKNKTPVVSAQLKAPFIKFSIERKGKKYGWEKAGEVIVYD